MSVLTRKGYTGRNLGRASYLEAPPEWRATTVQACGLYPFAIGSGSPPIGTPLGQHLSTGQAVCFDPFSWFTRARLISNPSLGVLGLPGLGKSTLVRRLCIGAAAGGAVPLVLGDTRPDYVALVKALGGQVIRLGRGFGALNVLDDGGLHDAAALIDAMAQAAQDERDGLAADLQYRDWLDVADTRVTQLRDEAVRLREEAHGRRLNLLAALLTVVRRGPVDDHELTILSAALALLSSWYAGHDAPLLPDLIGLLEQAPEQVRAVTLDRGDLASYRRVVDPLMVTLGNLTQGALGAVFAQPTTERLRLDAPAVCMDLSSISPGDHQLQAAALLACWSAGFGAVEAANALADVGAGPQRRFLVVLDELWKVLRAGEGLVDRVDELSRLNRSQGVGQCLITHSLADLSALRTEDDRAKARGLFERCGAVIVGGLPRQELTSLEGVVPLTAAEADLLTSWSTPPNWSALAEPPGRGRFLLKVGQRPGVPFRTRLTQAEHSSGVHDTNSRWTT